jgi:hypothetical protein
MSEEIIKNLGPLAPLAGIWEGDKGTDTSRIRSKKTVTHYREKAVFIPIGPVKNGPQELYGLRYSMTAWPISESGEVGEDAFHEELGYWLWDKGNGQVLRSFMVPRGVVVNAGGCVDENSKEFHLEAECGSETYGVMSNKFLDETYKTKRYLVDVKVDDGMYSYKQDTQLWIPVDQAIFHHTDENTLEKLE